MPGRKSRQSGLNGFLFFFIFFLHVTSCLCVDTCTVVRQSFHEVQTRERRKRKRKKKKQPGSRISPALMVNAINHPPLPPPQPSSELFYCIRVIRTNTNKSLKTRDLIPEAEFLGFQTIWITNHFEFSTTEHNSNITNNYLQIIKPKKYFKTCATRLRKKVLVRWKFRIFYTVIFHWIIRKTKKKIKNNREIYKENQKISSWVLT